MEILKERAKFDPVIIKLTKQDEVDALAGMLKGVCSGIVTYDDIRDELVRKLSPYYNDNRVDIVAACVTLL